MKLSSVHGTTFSEYLWRMTLGENKAAVTTIDVTLLVLCWLLRAAVAEPRAAGGRLNSGSEPSHSSVGSKSTFRPAGLVLS